MRKIGTVAEESLAQRFVDYLYSDGIAAHVDTDNEGPYGVWVEDEDALKQAHAAFESFLQDPQASQYQEAAENADKMRKVKKRADAAFSRQVYDRARLERRANWGAIPVTRILIILSILATLAGGLGSDSEVMQWLVISRHSFARPWLPEIMRGQIWRLFTPIFLHASLLSGGLGFLHILFNMLWLTDLGGMIERVQGGKALLVKVLVIGGISNLLQFYITGPAFGGMSGVVFGLLGYCWVRGKQDVTSGLFVSPQTMFIMTLWFFLGFSGFMGPIANAAHGGGLAIGLGWGYFSAMFTNVRRG